MNKGWRDFWACITLCYGSIAAYQLGVPLQTAFGINLIAMIIAYRIEYELIMKRASWT